MSASSSSVVESSAVDSSCVEGFGTVGASLVRLLSSATGELVVGEDASLSSLLVVVGEVVSLSSLLVVVGEVADSPVDQQTVCVGADLMSSFRVGISQHVRVLDRA